MNRVDLVTIRNELVIAPLLEETRKEVVGLTINLLGVNLRLLFNATYANFDEQIGLVRRPTEFVWRRGVRRHYVVLTWPMGTPERTERWFGLFEQLGAVVKWVSACGYAAAGIGVGGLK